MVAVVIGLVALALSWRIDRWMRDRQADAQAIEIQRLAQDRDSRERELALREREIAIAERNAPSIEVPPVTEFPPEMLANATNESEEWAREAGILLIGEAYVEAGGDWKRASTLLSHRYAMQPESRLPRQMS
jgi:hypothetical protein